MAAAKIAAALKTNQKDREGNVRGL